MKKDRIRYKNYILTATPAGVEIRSSGCDKDAWPIEVVPDMNTAKARIDKYLQQPPNAQKTLFE